MTKPVLQIIIASTRPGRVGLPVGEWFNRLAIEHAGFDVELIDLATVNLPMFDEPVHPRFADYKHEHTRNWSATIARGDAFVLVMPEYNHGFNAAIKNALDYLAQEWAYKPVGFVSYGGIAAGTRAVQMLKPVLVGLKLVCLVEAVNIPMVAARVKEGVFESSEPLDVAARTMLDELVRWGSTLSALRHHGTQ